MRTDLAKSSDTDLMRFCVGAARRLRAGDCQTSARDLTARLNAALDELNARYSEPNEGTAND